MKHLLILILSVAGLLAHEPGEAGQAVEVGGSSAVGRTAALATLTNCVQVSANSSWTVALKLEPGATSGSLTAWGSEGTGDFISNLPTGTNFVQVFAGWEHGIAIETNHTTGARTILEWGQPYGFALADWIALRPTTFTNASLIAAGDDHSAVVQNGVLYLYGGRSSVTNQNAVYTNVIGLHSGWYHILALRDDGTCVTFGGATSGQDNTVPPEATDIIGVGGGVFSNLAWKSDGTLVGWGLNNAGQTTIPASATNVVMASGGRYHSVALRGDGSLVQWGTNTSGQLNLPSGTNYTYVTGGYYQSAAITASLVDDPSTIHVAITGNDLTGDGSESGPYRRIQKGLDVAIAGQTVLVQAGAYDEYNVTKAHSVTLMSSGVVSTKQLRVNNHTNITVNGIQFTGAQNTLAGHMRVEAGSHYLTVTNCTFGPGVFTIATNAYFNHTNATVQVPGADFAALGFEVDGWIYVGGTALTNYWHENHDRAFQITAISGDTMTLSGSFATQTNYSGKWAPIYAGNNSAGMEGIVFIQSGGTGARDANIQGNLFTNLFGPTITLQGSGHTFANNEITAINGYYGIRPNGNDVLIYSNYWHNTGRVVHYTAAEIAEIEAVRATGGSWWDYQMGFIHATGAGTNIHFFRNWIENARNPLGQINELTNAYGFYVRSNVFVGIAGNLSGGRNALQFENNTFYKCGIDGSALGALSIGGNNSSNKSTNQAVLRNAFIDCGPHSSTNFETGYATTAHMVNFVGNSNFIAAAESMGWRGTASFADANGVNGGNPYLQDIGNPLGADGIPFTADDGLRPLSFSPLAYHGWGAMEAVTVSETPFASFELVGIAGTFKDYAGEDYDSAWVAAPFYTRTNLIRPYATPDNLGRLPLALTFSASNLVSAYNGGTNYDGVTGALWDFGDGSTWWAWTNPVVTHTYLSTGNFTVSLTVTNRHGNSDTVTRTFKIEALTNSTPKIWYVSTSGTDATTGTNQATPARTIQYAADRLTAGDYVAVLQGNYDEDVDLDVSLASRTYVHGFGATNNAFDIHLPNYEISGFDFVLGSSNPGGNINMRATADDVKIVNNRFSNPSSYSHTAAILMANGTGGDPANLALNLVATNNYFKQFPQPLFRIAGKGHLVSRNYGDMSSDTSAVSGGDANFLSFSSTADAVVSYNRLTGWPTASAGHPDVFQWTGIDVTNTVNWFSNIWIVGNIADAQENTEAAIAQMSTVSDASGVTAAWYYTNTTGQATNIYFLNNSFTRLRGGSVSVNGVKFYNNGFYFCAYDGSSAIGGGSDSRGYIDGRAFTNNIFFRGGTGGGTATNGGWYGAPSYSPVTNMHANYNYVVGANYWPKRESTTSDLWGQRWKALDSDGVSSEANGINGGDPDFIDETNGDFRPSTNSFLVNAGANLTSIIPEAYRVDALGNTRGDTNWTIGPFGSSDETGGGSTGGGTDGGGTGGTDGGGGQVPDAKKAKKQKRFIFF
jgi:hypothetical protein